MIRKVPSLFNRIYIEEKYTLEAATCDRIAELIMDFCKAEKVDRKDAIRYRISAEECLLYWLQKGYEGNQVMIRMGRQMRRPYIILQVEGEERNPYYEENWEDPYYYHNILVGLNLEPVYTYKNGKNRITYRMKRKSPGQLATIGIIILAAVLVGILGRFILSEGLRQAAVDNLLNPLYEAFFRILGCVAGPMVFLSVIWGILGVGDVSTFGRIGRKMILTFTRNNYLAVFFGLLFLPIFRLSYIGSGSTGSLSGEIVKMILDILPPNIVEPFQNNNTLQIVFIAIVIGITMLYLGRQTEQVVKLVGEINTIVQYIMRYISNLVPYVIFLIILKLIWSGNLNTMAGIWKLALAILLGEFLLSVLGLLFSSFRLKVKPLILVKKCIHPVLIALTSASSAAAYASSMKAFDGEYGVDPTISGFGLPLSMVMQKPGFALYHLLLAFYLGEVSQVPCSPQWVITAVLISGIMAMASPPVPGGGAIAMSVMFSQLGIPDELIGLALTVDILADFIETATDTVFRHTTLPGLAHSLGMIDRDVLEKTK